MKPHAYQSIPLEQKAPKLASQVMGLGKELPVCVLTDAPLSKGCWW